MTNLLAALGGVRPSATGLSQLPLFLTPRAFLGPRERSRIGAARAGLRHVQTLVQRVDRGFLESPLGRETPYVLHALTEGRQDNPKDTGPGLIRTTPVYGDRGASLEVGADPERCRELLDRAVEHLQGSQAPPAVRAAWLHFVVAAIHPFADGNGRTSRQLYMLLATEELGERMDWGLFELVRFRYGSMTAVLREANSFEPYDAANLDPGLFIRATLTWSSEAAQLMLRRLYAMDEMHRAVVAAGLDDVTADIALGTWLHRLTSPRDLATSLGWDPSEGVGTVARAENERVLERVAAPPSRKGIGPGPWFRVAPALDAAFRRVVLAERAA